MKRFCNASTSPQGIDFCYIPEVTVELSRWTVFWNMTDIMDIC